MKRKTNQNKSDWRFDSFVKTHERKFIKANPLLSLFQAQFQNVAIGITEVNQHDFKNYLCRERKAQLVKYLPCKLEDFGSNPTST